MYTPDKWVVVTITRDDGTTIDKVLGGWYGGYTGSNSWRLNSGIERVEDCDDHYLFHGYSGSTYKCYKNAYGMSMMMQSIFNQLVDLFPTELNNVYQN